MNGLTKVYLSPFTNIYENLCLEDFFLRNSSEEFILFYINGPCVVLGNFQNPWKESNPKFLSEQEISLARRQSGGGCVYHDEGNLNFCFFRNKNILSEADKELHLAMIRELLQSKKIQTQRLPKSGMLFLDGAHKLKFSGEAFKQISSRSFHHGTLLIDSNLAALKDSLNPVFPRIESKAVNSNPYQVGNLSRLWKELTPLKFIEEFRSFHGLSFYDAPFAKVHAHVMDNGGHWASREQVLGKTPDFELCHNGKRYSVRKARVYQIDGRQVEEQEFSVENI